MPLDPHALAESVVKGMKSALRAALAPLDARLSVLETRTVQLGPAGRDGVDGKDGAPGQIGQVGPQGERGLTGEQGPRGEKGETGDVGPIGERGLPGERGEKGEPGQAGPQGERGLDGSIGKDGAPGLDGKDGLSVSLEDVAALVDGVIEKQLALRQKSDDVLDEAAIARELVEVLEREVGLTPLRTQKRVVRDAQGRVERVVDEPVA